MTVPTHAHSQGLHAHSLAGSPYTHTLGPCTRACTGSPHLLTCRVPTRVGLQGPQAHSLVGSPYHMHWAHACTLAPGPHAHSHAGSPRALARRVSIHACSGPMHTCSLTGSPCTYICVYPSAVCIGRVICSSSTVL